MADCGQEGQPQGHVADGDDDEGEVVGVVVAEVGRGGVGEGGGGRVDEDAAGDQPARAEHGGQGVVDGEELQIYFGGSG